VKAVLGIDSSCYTSSCALVDAGMQVLASHRILIQVDPGERGLRQSEAVFAHLKQLPLALSELMSKAQADIVAVCVSNQPRDQEDSYMPVFRTGVAIAESIAMALRVPLYTTSHQRGHIASASMYLSDLPDSSLVLHLSGGTTDLLMMDGEKLSALSKSDDLHAGQLIDRVGVALGLPFPAGTALEALALRGRARGRYASSVDPEGCHLSGAEAQAMRDIATGDMSAADIAAEVFDLLARTAFKMLNAAGISTGVQDALVFGGVASSQLLRDLLIQRVQARHSTLRLHFGRPELSGDNAVGVAVIGAKQHFAIRKQGGS
jgi:N6-L-threonylcarbamoyladenine synthase